MSTRTRAVAAAVILVALAYYLYSRPPFAVAHRGELLVRTNELDGSVAAYSAGTVLAVPGIHQTRRFDIRDQVYRPTASASATGAAAFQSNEGLSIGVELAVRWAIDRGRLARMSREYPDDINADLVRPAVEGVTYPLFARYTVRDIFSQQRRQIQKEIETELRPKFASMGLVLRGVEMGKVDLPPDFRAGMEKLLAEELETEKIRYTMQLKEAGVKQSQLEAEAEKVKREEAAEAAAQEQVIAARAQEETMKHILPLIERAPAVVMSVQPLESWRELWVFHQIGGKWLVDVLSPGLDEPDAGYVEFAGFAPATSRLLLVREVRERTRLRRWFEEVRLDDLVLVRQASTPELLRDFGRWQDVRWRRDTLALRLQHRVRLLQAGFCAAFATARCHFCYI